MVDVKALYERLDQEALLEGASTLTPDSLSSDWAKTYQVTQGFDGRQSVCGVEVTLRIGLTRYFPQALPLVFLEPWDALGFIPHVEISGNVCYQAAEGTLLDRSQPHGIIEAALRLTKQALKDGYTGRNRADLADEFDAYWLQLEGVESLTSYVRPTGGPREIIVARGEKGYAYVADAERNIKDYLSGRDSKQLTLRNALYIPLHPESIIVPPKPGYMWNIGQIRQIVCDNVVPQDLKTIQKLSRKHKSEELMVLGLPRQSGGSTLVGIRFYGVESAHPLRKEGHAKKVIPVHLERRDSVAMVPRGGGRESLAGKRILLVGCGAIGGFLAFNLAHAGIPSLTLVDPQRLGSENTFRHRLGRKYLNKFKTDGLKAELEQTLPYLSITSFPHRFEDVFEDNCPRLEDFDLVITALGLPTLELYINELIHHTSSAPPLIITWLEPYGIGGHALLTHHASGRGVPQGCFECLFTAPTDDPPLYNRASFAAAEQGFTKNISGCGSLYTPYGALDATRTAELAARLAVRTLEERVTGNPILSWKGMPDDFLSAGHALSVRYELDESVLARTRLAYIDPACRICGEPAS